MTQKTIDSTQIIIGVDTHKDTHAAVALNALGARLGDRIEPANPAGYAQLLNWAKTFGQQVAFGVEGTGLYGKGSDAVPASSRTESGGSEPPLSSRSATIAGQR